MRNFFFLLIFISFQSCDLNECITYGKSDHQEIIFYYRYIIGVNNVYTYDDYVIITNYKNNSMTVSDFNNIAQNYIDTATRSDTLIGSVIFMRQYPGDCVPKPTDDYLSNITDLNKKVILEMSFRSEGIDNRPSLSAINICKNKKFQRRFTYINAQTRDSILNSKVLIDN